MTAADNPLEGVEIVNALNIVKVAEEDVAVAVVPLRLLDTTTE